MVTAPIATDHWRALFHRAAVANAQYWLQTFQAPPSQVAITPVNYAGVSKAISAALELEEAWRWGSDLAKTFHNLARRQGAYWTEWLDCLARWSQKSEEQQEPAARARALMYIGEIHERRGEWATAEHRFQAALRLFENCEDAVGRGQTLINLSQVYRLQRKYDVAEAFCRQALNLFEELKDLKRIATVYNNLGLIYRDQGQSEQALEQFELAYDLGRQSGTPYLLADVCMNLGTIYRRLSLPQKAIEYLEQAIELYQETGDAIHQAMARMGLGNVYLNLSQLEQAERSYLQAERTLQQSQSRLEQAQVYHNLGMVYVEKRDWIQAQVCLERAVNTWRKLGQVRGLVNSLDSLGELFIKTGEESRARRVLSEALEVLDRSSQTLAMEALRRMVTGRLGELDQKSQ